MKWLQLLLLGEGTTENREHVVEGNGFFTLTRLILFVMPEEHIIRTSFAKPCYFLFASENKRQL